MALDDWVLVTLGEALIETQGVGLVGMSVDELDEVVMFAYADHPQVVFDEVGEGDAVAPHGVNVAADKGSLWH